MAGETVFFSNDGDSRVYRLDPGMDARPITPESASRWADGDVTNDAPTVKRAVLFILNGHRENSRGILSGFCHANLREQDVPPGQGPELPGQA